MNVIGIDVGAKGSLVHLKNGELIKQFEFNKSSIKEYKNYLLSLDSKPIISVEQVASMRGQGVKSMFSFGTRFGEIIGMLETLDLEYNLIKPKEWQKKILKYDYLIDIEYQDIKEKIAHIIMCLYYGKFNINLDLLKTNLRSKKLFKTDKSDAIAIAMASCINLYDI